MEYKILELTGKMGSGKSSILSEILKQLTTDYGYTTTRAAFAAPIKKLLVESSNLSKLGPVGPVFFNRSRFLEMLSVYSRNVINLTQSLSEKINHLGSLIDKYRETNEIGLIREMLQFIGTEIGRDEIDKDIWLNVMVDYIVRTKEVAWDFIGIDDHRFPNEDLKNYFPHNTIIIKITAPEDVLEKRLGYKPKLNHASESNLDSLKYDIEIVNDGSESIEQIASKLIKEVIL